MVDRTVTVVSGLGRCGSSLVCQMLYAGGLKSTGSAGHPFWEDSRTAGLPDDCAWVYEIPPRSFFKCLNLWLKAPPKGPAYRWIWLDRNHKAQSKSWDKFVERERRLKNNPNIRRKKIDFEHDRAECMKAIRYLGGPLLRLRFEDLTQKPRATAERISAFVGGMDVERALQVVVKRPTKCLDFMLEDRWVAVEGGAE